ncbi:unnamed protein product [Enterobius vermicularis]|uniref:DUF2431 domain-containing protein n=1 Tax=Enterobius vermicularis TaxID=51028 RepID=A0A0N4VNF9_ENTVE|nr:unnamed protein product [Enterobius vermicularis]
MRQFVPQKEESHLFAVHYTTYSVVPKQYSLYLKKQLENYDVKFEDQLFYDYEVIVNCAITNPGILAADGDSRTFKKHRKSFVEVDTKNLHHFLSKGFDTYVIPHTNSVFAGLHETVTDDEALRTEEQNSDLVLNRAVEYQPSLKVRII